MKTAIVKLKSASPYTQSRFHNTPKLDKESNDDCERRTWRNRMHTTKDGNVFIPPMAFKNCLSAAAKYLSVQIPGKGKATYTKHFEAGVLVTEPLILPTKAEHVEPLWLHVPSDGVRGGGKRVLKAFPTIQEWEGSVTFYILDETITQDIFTKVLEEAGKFIGIGTFRPANNSFHGRFTVESVEWK